MKVHVVYMGELNFILIQVQIWEIDPHNIPKMYLWL